jgi:hypothetical protein
MLSDDQVISATAIFGEVPAKVIRIALIIV